MGKRVVFGCGNGGDTIDSSHGNLPTIYGRIHGSKEYQASNKQRDTNTKALPLFQ
ncbi:MAG: hypothetical protein O3C43_23495 [Verrucomicrobia bacterium]|nr:hypothetical protein [Verrucomicrobiota bacterium]